MNFLQVIIFLKGLIRSFNFHFASAVQLMPAQFALVSVNILWNLKYFKVAIIFI